ncbi:MAG: four helix bundle protein [Bacteroidia bacterium]|jgi:four helix bundle protein|nr:four helix bundle protein [Bacteroidota bacterium]MBP6512865.1 four helix bundle protein [Bacteroidia bacterium]
MKRDNIVLNKSFDFASKILDLHQLVIEQKHFQLASQLVRSGTSIGANINESQRAVSTADFINKLGIALKEAEETNYWLTLIDLKIVKIDPKLKADLDELIRLLVSIINSTKRNNSR